MMQGMMGQMLRDMPVDERVSFMRAMMETCLPLMTEGMDTATRQQMVRDLLGQMMDSGQPGTSAGDGPSQ